MTTLPAAKPGQGPGLVGLWHRLRARRARAPAPASGVVCISMVKNEQDIIEPFVRHNAPFFDAMIVLDNASTDNTRAILVDLARELGTVVVADRPEFAHHQWWFMTQALRHVQSAYFADAICFLDADEFISAPSPDAFRQAIARIPVGGLGLMSWQTFLPDPDLDETDRPDPLERMNMCRVAERPPFNKVVLRLGGAFDPGLTVMQGNHMVRSWRGRKLRRVVMPDVRLKHFPVRSCAQHATKGVIGWMANQARGATRRHASEAFQWQAIHDRVMAGQAATTPHDLAQAAMAYAQTDVPPDFWSNARRQAHGITCARRHSDGRYGDPASLIDAARNPRPMRGQDFRPPASPDGKGGGGEIEHAFDGAWHRDNLFLDAPPIQFVMERFRPRSVLDVGCGSGVYPLLYLHHGAEDVLGLDGIAPEATVLGPDRYRKVDLQLPQDVVRRFDLVVCLEVVEHLRPDATSTILDTIDRHAGDLILFSMAEPGQPGHGHINCRTMDQVLALWAARGWQPDLGATLATRALATMSWFRRNTVLLRRTGATAITAEAEALSRIARLPYRWYPQAPGIRLAPFAETWPSLRAGYGLLRA